MKENGRRVDLRFLCQDGGEKGVGTGDKKSYTPRSLITLNNSTTSGLIKNTSRQELSSVIFIIDL